MILNYRGEVSRLYANVLRHPTRLRVHMPIRRLSSGGSMLRLVFCFADMRSKICTRRYQVLLTRGSPIFPFPLINYAHGVTRVSPMSYFLGKCLVSWFLCLVSCFLSPLLSFPFLSYPPLPYPTPLSSLLLSCPLISPAHSRVHLAASNGCCNRSLGFCNRVC